jgi:hypothetical protein
MEMKFDSNDQLDPNVIAGIRSVYAAPEGDAYWTSLEARVMTRIRSAGNGRGDLAWWTVLANWSSPGLAAAALMLAVAGGLWWRLDRADATGAYEGFTQTMVADAMPGAAQLLDIPRDGSSRREATLTYVLSH